MGRVLFDQSLLTQYSLCQTRLHSRSDMDNVDDGDGDDTDDIKLSKAVGLKCFLRGSKTLGVHAIKRLQLISPPFPPPLIGICAIVF